MNFVLIWGFASYTANANSAAYIFVRIVQEFLRHASIATTQRYPHHQQRTPNLGAEEITPIFQPPPQWPKRPGMLIQSQTGLIDNKEDEGLNSAKPIEFFEIMKAIVAESI